MTEGERTPRRPERQAPEEAWTIGHSSLDLDVFVATLRAHGIARVADVRRYPASRRHPQFNRETLATVLEARGVGYRWFEDLGGRRPGSPSRESPNRGLKNPSFRNYADFMGSDEFHAAFSELCRWAMEGRTALMCAEAWWSQCHRRFLADLLVTEGTLVHHILDARRSEPHTLWTLARRIENGVVYPPVQGELPFS